MTLWRALLLSVAWFAAVFLMAVLYLSLRQQPPLAVDEAALSPACATKPLPNPCAKIDCRPRIDTRKLT